MKVSLWGRNRDRGANRPSIPSLLMIVSMLSLSLQKYLSDFDFSARECRLKFVEAVKLFEAENENRTLETYISLRVVRSGGLPYEYTINQKVRRIRYADLLQAMGINPKSPKGRKSASKKAPRGNYPSRTALAKVAQLHFVYAGDLVIQQARDMLPQNPQGPEAVIIQEQNAQRILKQMSNVVRAITSTVGHSNALLPTSSIVFSSLTESRHMLKDPDFLADHLLPFGTPEERLRYFASQVEKQPMLLIAWLHKCCPGLYIQFIFGNYKYRKSVDREDLNGYRTKMRRSLRGRGLYTFDVISKEPLNSPRENDDWEFKKHVRWVSHISPSLSNVSANIRFI
jgi:hypothetical protein